MDLSSNILFEKVVKPQISQITPIRNLYQEKVDREAQNGPDSQTGIPHRVIARNVVTWQSLAEYKLMKSKIFKCGTAISCIAVMRVAHTANTIFTRDCHVASRLAMTPAGSLM
jgi:hypothetical protein